MRSEINNKISKSELLKNGLEYRTYYTANSVMDKSDFWSKICTIHIQRQYVDANVIGRIVGTGNSSANMMYMEYALRVKQQNALGEQTDISLVALNRNYLSLNNIKAIQTANDAVNGATVELWVQQRAVYNIYHHFPLINLGDAVFHNAEPLHPELPASLRTIDCIDAVKIN